MNQDKPGRPTLSALPILPDDGLDRPSNLGEYCHDRTSFMFAGLLFPLGDSNDDPQEGNGDASEAQRVLFVAPRLYRAELLAMGVLARTLQQQGAQVRFLLCDNLPTCELRATGVAENQNERALCDTCIHDTAEFCATAGFAHNSIWDVLESKDISAARAVAARAASEDAAAPGANGQRSKHELQRYSAEILRCAFERFAARWSPTAVVTPPPESQAAELARQTLHSAGCPVTSLQGEPSWLHRYHPNTPKRWLGLRGGDLRTHVQSLWEQTKQASLHPISEAAVGRLLARETVVEDDASEAHESASASDDALGSTAASDGTGVQASIEIGMDASDLACVATDALVLFVGKEDASLAKADNLWNAVGEAPVWLAPTLQTAATSGRTTLVRTLDAVADDWVGEKIAQLTVPARGVLIHVPSGNAFPKQSILRKAGSCAVGCAIEGLEAIALGCPTWVLGKPCYAVSEIVKPQADLDAWLQSLEQGDVPDLHPPQLEAARRFLHLLLFRTAAPLPPLLTFAKATRNADEQAAASKPSDGQNMSAMHGLLLDLECGKLRSGEDPYTLHHVQGILAPLPQALPEKLQHLAAVGTHAVNQLRSIIADTVALGRLREQAQTRHRANSNDAVGVALAHQVQEALAYQPNSPVANASQRAAELQAAWFVHERGETDAGLAICDTLLTQTPNDPDVLMHMSAMLQRCGQWELSRILLQRLQWLGNDTPRFWGMTVVQAEVGHDLNGLHAGLKGWLDAHPQDPIALLGAAALTAEHGNGRALRDRLTAWLAAAPEHPVAQRMLKGLGFSPKAKAAAPLISVLLCSYNRQDTLAECLAALEKQDLPAELFEVVCVDDGSGDRTSEVMLAYLDRHQGSHHRHATNRGLAAARNTAMDAAKGDILVFINDDTHPAPNFLSEHLGAHQSHGSDAKVAILGHIEFAQQHQDRLLSHILHQHNFLFPLVGAQPNQAYDFDHFVTGNLSVPRKAFLGGSIRFDETFKRYGCEDIEVGYRLWQQGYRVYYHPQALTWHDHRLTISDLIRREENNGANLVQFVDKHPELAKRYYGGAELTAEKRRDWRHQIDRDDPLVRTLASKIELVQDLSLEERGIKDQLPTVATAVRQIRDHIKAKAILDTLDGAA